MKSLRSSLTLRKCSVAAAGDSLVLERDLKKGLSTLDKSAAAVVPLF